MDSPQIIDMKNADPDKQQAYELKSDELYKRLKEFKTEDYGSDAYGDACSLYNQHRNSCPQCGSENTKVENYDAMWHDGDLVCQDCGTFVRGWDAG